ncbi:unnamed protein product [Acanthosepion pharaonis]|uniref:Uncharacterized protein n=1 Tax=Acanthosepion pharaonis TaxID=158019 RepID=A0A812EJL8_ACAPH|nr:unnamed protein product [Sepia pharaonis]
MSLRLPIGLTSESHSITTLQGSTHSTFATAFPLRHQLQHPAASSTPAASSIPAVSSSLQPLSAHSYRFQLTPAASSTPAAFSSPLRRSTDVRTPFPNKRPLSSSHPPFASKDTISIVYNGPSAFVILLCYCHLLAFVSPILVVRSIGTHTSRSAATTV